MQHSSAHRHSHSADFAPDTISGLFLYNFCQTHLYNLNSETLKLKLLENSPKKSKFRIKCTSTNYNEALVDRSYHLNDVEEVVEDIVEGLLRVVLNCYILPKVHFVFIKNREYEASGGSLKHCQDLTQYLYKY